MNTKAKRTIPTRVRSVINIIIYGVLIVCQLLSDSLIVAAISGALLVVMMLIQSRFKPEICDELYEKNVGKAFKSTVGLIICALLIAVFFVGDGIKLTVNANILWAAALSIILVKEIFFFIYECIGGEE